jgi:hypothetical protein
LSVLTFPAFPSLTGVVVPPPPLLGAVGVVGSEGGVGVGVGVLPAVGVTTGIVLFC